MVARGDAARFALDAGLAAGEPYTEGSTGSASFGVKSGERARTMRTCIFLLLAAAICGCGASNSGPTSAATLAPTSSGGENPEAVTPSNRPNAPGTDDFFAGWFKAHGHENVVIEPAGVGVADDDTRLRASLYDSKQHDNGGFVVETEFDVRLPDGRSVVEFVAGMGESEEQAVRDSMLNFTLTTFHVVYKGFINDADPHMKAEKIVVGGQQRELIAGDFYMRGGQSFEKLDMDGVQKQIKEAVARLPLAPAPHWIKIVYAQNDGQSMTVSVTLDNAGHPELTAAVEQMPWPKVKEFYLAKQFLVVR